MPAPDDLAAPAAPPRSAGWHIAGSIAAWALPLLTTIVAMPLLWRSLGRDGYGVYILAAGYAGLAGSLGSMRGAAQRVSAGASSGHALQAAIGGAYLAAIGTGGAALAGAMALAPAFLRLADIDPDASPATVTAFRLAAASALNVHLSHAARGVLIGLQRYDLYSAHITGATVVNTVGMVVLAAAGQQAPGLMAWLLASTLFSAVAAVALVRMASGVRPTQSWPDGQAVLRFGATIVATEAVLNLYVLAERTLLTRAMGVGAVAEYTIPLGLASALQNAMAAGAVVLLPRAGAAWARGDTAALRVMYTRAVKVILLVAVGGSAVIAGGAETFVGWWIDPQFGRVTAGTVAVLLAAFAVNAAATPMWLLGEGAGQPLRNTAFSAALAAIGVGAAVMLAPSEGALGLAWARGLGMLAVPVFIVAGERHLFGGVQPAIWKAIAFRLLPAAGVLIAAVMFTERSLTGLSLLGANALLGALFAAWLWRSGYFDLEERRAVGRLVGVRV